MSYLVSNAVESIQNDEIEYTINKGTTEYISLTLKDKATGNTYVMGSNEKAIFGIKRRLDDSVCLVTKQFDVNNFYDGKYTFSLSSSQTNIPQGRYWFDVGVKLSNGDFVKPIENKLLRIKGNVTSLSDIS